MWNKKFKKADRKKFLHLIQYIIDLIDSGELSAGQVLPTQRELSQKLGVSIGTITKAFNELEKMGYLSGEIGRGTFVKDISGDYSRFWYSESKVPYEYNLGHFRTTELFNHSIQLSLLSSIREATNDTNVFAQLHDLYNLGNGDLKNSFAKWVKPLGFSNVSESNISILSSDVFSITTLINALTSVDDVVLIEEIGDRITHDQIIASGRKVLTVKIDDDGIDPDALKKTISSSKAKLLITNPTFHNPTGITTGITRKKEIAKVCASAGVMIVEDGKTDMFSDTPIHPYFEINPDVGVYTTGLYFHINPSLTTSIVIGNNEVIRKTEEAFTLLYWNGSQILHQIVFNLLESGNADLIINAKKKLLNERNSIVDDVFFGTKHSGFSNSTLRWIPIPDQKSSAELTQIAYENGILVRNSDIFKLNQNLDPFPFIRICNGSINDIEDFKKSVKKLASLFNAQPTDLQIR